jgi:hypothetical protein
VTSFAISNGYGNSFRVGAFNAAGENFSNYLYVDDVWVEIDITP